MAPIGTVLAAAAAAGLAAAGLQDMVARPGPVRAGQRGRPGLVRAGQRGRPGLVRAGQRGRTGQLPVVALLLLSAALASCGDDGRDAAEAALLGVPAAGDSAAIGGKADGAAGAVPASRVTLPPATDLMGPPRPGQSLDMKMVPPPEPLSITYPTELPDIAAAATRLMIKAAEDEDLGRRDVARLDLFNRTPPGWAFRQRGFHRAMSVARPALCSHVVADSGYATPEEAATDTLLRCYDYAAERGDALRIDCRCQLAALDEALFLAPEQIDWRPALPALFQTSNRSPETRGFYGVLEMNRWPTTGEPVRVYGRDGSLLCRGRRWSNNDRGGWLRMTCFATNDAMQGSYRIAGRYLGEPHGTAVVAGFQRRMTILFGLDGRNFERRLRQIQAGGAGGRAPARLPPVGNAAPFAADPRPIAPPFSDTPSVAPGRAGVSDLPPPGFLENAVPLPPQRPAVRIPLPAAPAGPDPAAAPRLYPAPVGATPEPATPTASGSAPPPPAGRAGPSDRMPSSESEWVPVPPLSGERNR